MTTTNERIVDHPLMGKDFAAYFEGLTESQAEAVRLTDGPLLVLAAAGSGKTLTITRRIAYLIAKGQPPWSILALTFTNKAAGEMRQRVEQLIPPAMGAARGMVVSTFHAFCARLLRRYGEWLGLKPDYTIYDTSDQKAVFKEVIARLDLSTTNFKPEAMAAEISNQKNRLITPKQYAQSAGDFWSRNIARIYEQYEEHLKRSNAVDFDDLLLHVAMLLRDHDEVREELSQRFTNILVDEYQDTNHAQFVIAYELARQHRRICVVGDPDQSIYAWRGADISNILEFQEQFPDAQIVKLGENFRSTAPILAVADHLIKHNLSRKDKQLYTKRPGGVKPTVRTCPGEHEEAAAVWDFFDELSREYNVPWKEMAVLYRTNALSRVMESALRSRGVPYVLVRGTAFYDRREIRDCLAYLRIILNPEDDVSLTRIINEPPRGIGKTTIDKVAAYSRKNNVPLIEAFRLARQIDGITGRSLNGIERFLEQLDMWRDAGSFMGVDAVGELAELVERIITEAGFEAYYRKSGTEDDAQRLDNLAELVSAAAEFEQTYEAALADDAEFDPFADPFDFATLQESATESADGVAEQRPPLMAKLQKYLEQVALVSDVEAFDPEAGAITLMTLHAAKGLEFRAVAIIGMEEGLLPHSRALESEADMEEERRLCFVGITRAKEFLMFTHAAVRAMRGVTEPTLTSRFLRELPEEHINWVNSQPTDFTTGSGSTAARPPFSASRARGGGGDSSVAMRGLAASQKASSAVSIHSETRPRKVGAFAVGAHVRHPQFGDGTLQSVSAQGSHTRLIINFRDVGVKTLVAEYARLQLLAD